MVGSTLFSRPLAGFMSKSSNSSPKSQAYAEMLLDDDEDDDEYYEEIIVDDDGEEYIEEVIEEEEEEEPEVLTKVKRAKDDLLVTQEQVDAMSLQNAKKFLMALPSAKGPTLVPTKHLDSDYEYEEVEMPDAITPIRRSRRFSLFDAPALDNIVEESSERSDRSGATSVLNSPSMSSKKKELHHNLSNIAEGSEKSPGNSPQGSPQPPAAAPLMSQDDDCNTSVKENKNKEEGDDSNAYLPEGTILVGNLNDTEEKDKIVVENDPSGKPVTSSTRSINRSNKSIHSEGTDTTMSESGSNTSLDIRQVFASPPASPCNSPDLASQRKRPESARRASDDHIKQSPDPSKSRSSSESSLGKGLKKLGNSSGHSSSRRRSTGSSSRRGDDDDDDNRSTRSGKSRRSTSGRSGRRSSTKTTTTTVDRALTVEAEIMQLLSPEKEKKKQMSLDNMLSSESNRSAERVDSDNMSRSSRSRSRRRSSTSKGISSSSDKSRSSESVGGGGSSSRRASSTRIDSPTKQPIPKKKPTLAEGSKTLDDLLARLPAEPRKRSDAKSTASGILRSSRGRTRDSGRDSQSVVGGSSSNSSSRRQPRTRSARRTKKGDNDDASVSSMPAMGRKVRSRSSSVGRKERLRRGRQKEDAERANRKFQEEMKSFQKSFQDEKPPNSQRSNASSSSSSRRPSNSRSSSGSFDEDAAMLVEAESRSRRGNSSRDQYGREDKLQSPKHHKEQESNGRLRRSGSIDEDDEMIEEESRSRRGSSSSRDHHHREDKLQSPRHTSRGSSGKPHSSGSLHDHETNEPESRSRRGSRTTVSRPDHHRQGSSSGRPPNGDSRRPRTSSDRSVSSKADRDESRSARKMEDDDDFLDEMDGNASFSRTLMLARSLHDTADEKEQAAAPKTPTHRKSQITRSSSGGTRSPGDSHVRRSPGKTRSADNILMYDEADQDDGDEKHHPSRLSSVAGAMRDASTPKTPKTPVDRRREPLKKKHSSDDVLLVPELATHSDDYDLDEPRTPGGVRNRRPPSRAQSSRDNNCSRGQHEHRHASYHSPNRSSKAPLTPPTSSGAEKTRSPPLRAQSDLSPRVNTPTKLSQIRQASRTSDFKSPGLQSSSSSSPSIRRRSSMEMSPTKSSPARRGSMEMGSSGGVTAPPLTTSGAAAIVVFTPFERLSELEKIKTFLTVEEYESKKKEILACI